MRIIRSAFSNELVKGHFAIFPFWYRLVVCTDCCVCGLFAGSIWDSCGRQKQIDAIGNFNCVVNPGADQLQPENHLISLRQAV